jgi:hypothetical protein
MPEGMPPFAATQPAVIPADERSFHHGDTEGTENSHGEQQGIGVFLRAFRAFRVSVVNRDEPPHDEGVRQEPSR